MFSNTGILTKFFLRRDRISSTIWIFGILAMTLSIAYAFPGIFETEEERIVLVEMMQSPAMVAMLGPAYGSENGIDGYTNGAMMSNMMLLFTIIAVVIMNIFLVVKHTRKDEEAGRIEVIRSLPVGRLSNLSATMVVCIITNTILALLTGLGLYALQVEGMDLYGSFFYGMALGISGILFATITAVFCQLASNSRGAVGYSFSILGLSYLLQAGGASNEILSYISPLRFNYEITSIC